MAGIKNCRIWQVRPLLLGQLTPVDVLRACVSLIDPELEYDDSHVMEALDHASVQQRPSPPPPPPPPPVQSSPFSRPLDAPPAHHIEQQSFSPFGQLPNVQQQILSTASRVEQA